MKLADVEARKIISSMGSETVEVTVVTERDKFSAAVPAGISAGKYEVKNDTVEGALAQIAAIKPKIVGTDMSQAELDRILVEAGMAGNASLPISAAFWRASLGEVKTYNKFPKLFTLMFEGGKHGNPGITIQEFAVVEDTVEEAMQDFRKLRDYLESAGIETTVGAEGAFSPEGFDNLKTLDTISKVFADKKIALDVAGSFVMGGIDYKELKAKYNIASIEDPYSDEQWDEWKKFYDEFGQKIMVVGDDLTVTNSERIKRALAPQVVNAIIVKPNQNGTISGTLEAVKLAREYNLAIVVSHRAEETNDYWIADFALEVGADFVKFGGMDRGERIAKYNRLRDRGMG
ncbi:hypothetical protein A3D85_00105 [Candidatus Amesbacteria bacterium RIFCSPHIGHO2_02_FULL_47_9]|uniref:Enolase n=1 Tax=Candidatus Amesbacteria bacterium RIFCSPHIGHO2_01_FULL_48_32b TaxID=1797253 RepID=A0A1F4YHN3_9BACT|nr:MAG: hypothetical protein A2876_00020 [Candidatus Amesbacteria bacterium RIFCSPHIGHO2_01_FULL_48_32b]OGD04991.1 MAG: hypothetical protein A3D85_00105 [Candidatus Amesbacteria bacterium RIFCSPHIGHO2_02_FULL_47_9]OGD07118.1 MAG: hypothetical protein A2899_00870 [Candidatus Amesbacteria bacterium RIFCSPLOWO2_01_FULL_49_25]